MTARSEVPQEPFEPPRERGRVIFDIGKSLLEFSASQSWTDRGLMGDDMSFQAWDKIQKSFVYSDGVFQFGKTIGLGVNELAFEERLRHDHRVTYVGMTKTTYKDADLFTLSGSHYLHDYKPVLIIDNNTGYWEPGLDRCKGQHFSLLDNSVDRFPPDYTQHVIDEYTPFLGKEKAELAFGDQRENYGIMTASFLPNHGFTEARGGGRVEMRYFWDREAGKLTLESTKVEHLREPWGSPQRSVLNASDWTRFDSSTEDKRVVVKPFGVFQIPGTIDELVWFQDFMFPPTYPWSDPEEGGQQEGNTYNYDDIEETGGKVGYNIFGIKQVDTWKDFAGL